MDGKEKFPSTGLLLIFRKEEEWAGAKESNKIDIKTMQSNLLV